MQTASFIFYKDTTEYLTLAGHTQAVERTIQVMHSHMHEELTLEDLAAVAYLSPSRFKHVFRHLIGIPPGEFLSALRLQAARRLLLYHLRAAAFPAAANLHSSLLPGEKLLLGNNASPLVIRQGRVSGDTNLVLHAPRLTDPPLVMGLPLV